MAGVTFRVGGNMFCVLSDGRNAGVARATRPGNIAVIKVAELIQFEKSRGVVTFSAVFNRRLHMPLGFTDSYGAVMAFDTPANHFHVIDKGDIGESEACMTGPTEIAGADMIA
jgi:hypothetical protein